MNKRLILLSLISMLTFSACAVSKENVFDRKDYFDSVFENNYYKVKDEKIANKLFVSQSIELNKANNKVFETYQELKDLGIDEDVNNETVTYDSIIYSNANTTYGEKKCLGNYDDSYNYGILSKLTDGLLFCDQKTFQGVRVQIDEEGFIEKYDKQIEKADYFALSFKAGSDYTSPSYPSSAKYDIRLDIKFYIPRGNGIYEECRYNYVLNNVIRDRYYLFGFQLEKWPTIAGLGISYQLLNTNEDSNIKHCLNLYETLFVNPIIKD